MTIGDLQAIRKASASDRLWFEKHPTRSHRMRLAIAGEFGPIEFTIPGPAWAVIRQAIPGFRLRLPFTAPSPPPDIEEIGQALFDAVHEAMRAGKPGIFAEEVKARATRLRVRGRA
ncbi:MAG: hypothetical protein JO001_08680 [Alphaproteobacteria bacterium]|nr:hypothetical protein [Alphaproteobacteria bacterium]